MGMEALEELIRTCGEVVEILRDASATPIDRLAAATHLDMVLESVRSEFESGMLDLEDAELDEFEALIWPEISWEPGSVEKQRDKPGAQDLPAQFTSGQRYRKP